MICFQVLLGGTVGAWGNALTCAWVPINQACLVDLVFKPWDWSSGFALSIHKQSLTFWDTSILKAGPIPWRTRWACSTICKALIKAIKHHQVPTLQFSNLLLGPLALHYWGLGLFSTHLPCFSCNQSGNKLGKTDALWPSQSKAKTCHSLLQTTLLAGLSFHLHPHRTQNIITDQ